MAIRMALELGLNKEEEAEDGFTQPQPAEKWLQQEYRRRTFWSIFVLDRIQSAATGRPMFLQDEDCDLFLPSDEDGWTRGHFYTETIDKSRVAYFNIQDLQESNLLRVTATISAPTNVANADQKPELSCHAYMLHAIVLLGKLTMFINRGKITKSSLPPYHPESEFAQLDRQIDEWSDRLPPHLQNTAANLHKFRTNSSIDGGRFVMAHILHNALTVLLHRPSLVMADTLNSEMIQPALRNFINDSVKKCTKAVDAVTDMLRAINNCTSLMPPYLTYLSYTVATIAVNNTFSPNPEEANKAREALTVHFQLLQSMRIYWAMADKLYFMIRDLYAMHSNMQRVQANRNESSTSPSSFSSAREMPMNFPPPPPPATMPPSQVPPRFNSMAPNASLFSAPQTMTPSPIPPTLMRKMSLADVSASTCDGVSCTDWILGDNSENIAAALQSIVRSPGIGITGNNFFDLQMTNDMEAAGQLTGNELGWMYQFPANYSSGNQ
ncbi:fungal-specific transcription factor domain-containing protein [Radiomyces spectabilis]|uniref:fungal-specific transcription factor domain-containing protein n=1 Tax=Radiomyces spectabilis TaxID=64574 RepID=UPI00221FB2C8|nr:fungal-specific transcription factor domain-containing protein [Radiomyces spectabilis]KAI8376395.1 fungal-specific transcription factor domain-containing protein [Radiomyces spectabilis]